MDDFKDLPSTKQGLLDFIRYGDADIKRQNRKMKGMQDKINEAKRRLSEVFKTEVDEDGKPIQKINEARDAG